MVNLYFWDRHFYCRGLPLLCLNNDVRVQRRPGAPRVLWLVREGLLVVVVVVVAETVQRLQRVGRQLMVG